MESGVGVGKLGYEVWGLGFGDERSGCRVHGSGFRVWCLGFEVQGLAARVYLRPEPLFVGVGSYLRLLDFCITQL